MSKIFPNGIFVIIGISVIVFLNKCGLKSGADDYSYTGPKINGVSFVAPRSMYDQNPFGHLLNINANWVAIMPYAFCHPDDPEIRFDHNRQWWGEQTSGVIRQIEDARSVGMKVLLKPHVWTRGFGWNGDFDCSNENQWQKWEQSYETYILNYAHIADSMHAEMFCIGLEYKLAVKKRTAFWEQLIDKVRNEYSGDVIYAANWDNYKNIPFWDKLDYIGVNAYFPLSQKDTPGIDDLTEGYEKDFLDLRSFAQRHNKRIIFTEFGYRSIDQAAGNQWELPNDHWNNTGTPNLEAQHNAYEATFKTFWKEDWFGGGFLWKWYATGERRRSADTDYTPQDKPAEALIKKWYGNYN